MKVVLVSKKKAIWNLFSMRMKECFISFNDFFKSVFASCIHIGYVCVREYQYNINNETMTLHNKTPILNPYMNLTFQSPLIFLFFRMVQYLLDFNLF